MDFEAALGGCIVIGVIFLVGYVWGQKHSICPFCRAYHDPKGEG